ncbi:MAG: metallophosphoesterase [Rickettsiales bacterium]|nr:metallophosphoesterase [Rickettsiales bacterium]
MIKLYALMFFIILSSLFTCATYMVSGDLDSFAALGNSPKLLLLFISFGLSLLMLVLATSESVHRNIKHLVFFVLLIYMLIFLCFVCTMPLRLFWPRINVFKTTCSVLLIHFFLYCYGYVNKFFIRPTYYSIKTEKNVNLKVVFISDLHLGAVGTSTKLLKKIVGVINAQKADLVLLGGDTVETKVDYFDSLKYAELLKGIESKLGTYAILGNHEYYTGRTNLNRILEFLRKECGMRVLLDELVHIEGNLVLAGRVDGGYDRTVTRKKVSELLEKVGGADSFLLLLDHNPKYFDEAVVNNVDLQLSGHTHNGQMFPFNLFVKFLYEKPYGMLKKLNSTLLVSSGVGTWGPPVKVFSKPEVVVIEIKKSIDKRDSR